MRTAEQMDACEVTLVNLAIGRIFRILSRPGQPGDLADFERCRKLILDTLDDGDMPRGPRTWAEDRLKGAQGD